MSFVEVFELFFSREPKELTKQWTNASKLDAFVGILVDSNFNYKVIFRKHF